MGGGRIGDDDFDLLAFFVEGLGHAGGVGFKGVEVKADLRGTAREFMLVGAEAETEGGRKAA